MTKANLFFMASSICLAVAFFCLCVGAPIDVGIFACVFFVIFGTMAFKFEYEMNHPQLSYQEQFERLYGTAEDERNSLAMERKLGLNFDSTGLLVPGYIDWEVENAKVLKRMAEQEKPWEIIAKMEEGFLTLEQIKTMTPEQINERWDEVSKASETQLPREFPDQ